MEHFEYTKSWRNREDFPTFESSEDKVRDDMQCLFDEVADGINTLNENGQKYDMVISVESENGTIDEDNPPTIVSGTYESVAAKLRSTNPYSKPRVLVVEKDTVSPSGVTPFTFDSRAEATSALFLTLGGEEIGIQFMWPSYGSTDAVWLKWYIEKPT